MGRYGTADVDCASRNISDPRELTSELSSLQVTTSRNACLQFSVDDVVKNYSITGAKMSLVNSQ